MIAMLCALLEFIVKSVKDAKKYQVIMDEPEIASCFH